MGEREESIKQWGLTAQALRECEDEILAAKHFSPEDASRLGAT